MSDRRESRRLECLASSRAIATDGAGRGRWVPRVAGPTVPVAAARPGRRHSASVARAHDTGRSRSCSRRGLTYVSVAADLDASSSATLGAASVSDRPSPAQHQVADDRAERQSDARPPNVSPIARRAHDVTMSYQQTIVHPRRADAGQTAHRRWERPRRSIPARPPFRWHPCIASPLIIVQRADPW